MRERALPAGKQYQIQEDGLDPNIREAALNIREHEASMEEEVRGHGLCNFQLQTFKVTAGFIFRPKSESS